MAEMPSADNAASAGRTVTVTVSRPAQSGSSASGAAHMGSNDGVTVEIRRAGTASDPSTPQEQVIVTVSLNHADEQITVTL